MVCCDDSHDVFEEIIGGYRPRVSAATTHSEAGGAVSSAVCVCPSISWHFEPITSALPLRNVERANSRHSPVVSSFNLATAKVFTTIKGAGALFVFTLKKQTLAFVETIFSEGKKCVSVSLLAFNCRVSTRELVIAPGLVDFCPLHDNVAIL